jgi:hypothetical protein
LRNRALNFGDYGRVIRRVDDGNKQYLATLTNNPIRFETASIKARCLAVVQDKKRATPRAPPFTRRHRLHLLAKTINRKKRSEYGARPLERLFRHFCSHGHFPQLRKHGQLNPMLSNCSDNRAVEVCD